MKSTRFLLIGLSFLLFLSCEDFLDRPPLGSSSEENFFLNPDAGFSSVVKCYQTLNDFYGYEAPRAELGNMSTDDSEKGGSDAGDRPFVADLSFGRPLSSNTSLNDYWAKLYAGIGNCNICLENIPVKPLIDMDGYPVSEEVKARYLAEAKFLRAFFYFELAKIFGGVPLVDKTLTVDDATKLVRASENDIFLFISQSLEEVENEINLPSKLTLPTEELGRITKEIVWSMQARVYLYFAKNDNSLYAKASVAAKKVINSQSCALAPNFQSLFLKNGYKLSESIFPNIRGDNAGANIYGSFIPIYTSPRGPSGAWGFDTPTQNLVDEFEVGDPRLLFTVIESGDVFPNSTEKGEVLNFSSYPNTGFHSRKSYLVPGRRGPGWGDDAWSYHIIRYADVLLMYAEALLQSGGSKDDVAFYINEVRHRANNSRQDDAEAISRSITIPNIALKDVKSTDNLFEAIKHERRVELAMEYNRLYDLKRWNIYIETMNAYSALPYSNGRGSAFQKNVNELFPIPQVEIDRSQGSIKQNPGYN